MKRKAFTLFFAFAIALSSTTYAQTTPSELTLVKDNLQYRTLWGFSGGFSKVSQYADKSKKYELFGLIDTAGNEVISPKYHQMSNVSDGYVRVGMDTDNNSDTGTLDLGRGIDKWGFLNTKGETFIPLIYDKAEGFSQGLALVGTKYQYVQKPIAGLPSSTQIGYKTGFINKEGKVTVPLIYDEAKGFSEGLAVVAKNNKYGFVDKNGKVVVPLIYDYADSFSEGFAAVCKNDKHGFINAQGKVVIPMRYDYVQSFHEGLAVIEQGDKKGIINKQGNVILQPTYDNISEFSGGLAFVAQSNKEKVVYKYGFINTTGKVVIPLNYFSVSPFSDGLSIVKTTNELNKNYSVIDKSGKTILHYSNNTLQDFQNGFAIIGKNTYQSYNLSDTFGMIDKKGNELLPIKYSSIHYNDGYIIAKEQNGTSTIWKIK